MKSLIQFEMKKLFRTTFFRLGMLIFFLFVLFYYLFVYVNTMHTEEVILENEEFLYYLQSPVDKLKEAIESGEIEEDDGVKQEVEFREGEVAIVEERLSEYRKEDWGALLEKEIQSVRSDFETQLFNRLYYTSEWPTLFTEETRQEMNRWLQEKQISAILPLEGSGWTTIFDEVYLNGFTPDEEIKEIIEERSNKYSSVGIYYLNHVFGLLFSVFGAGFLLFLFGDVLTKEGLGRNGPIHLLHTQPIQRYKILIGKFLAVLFISISILVGTAILSLLLGTIFDRFGDWNYPVLIYGEDYAYEFINMSTFLMKSVALFFMVLLFCYSLLFLFSILTKRVLIALGLTLTTIFIGIKLSEEAILSSFASYVPFHYFSAPKVVTMELAASLKNFDFNMMNGVIVLGISSLVLLVLTYVSTVLQNKFSR